MRAELEGLNPQQRGVWYRKHVQEILDCYAEHGSWYTMEEYGMKQYTTLDNFLRQHVQEKEPREKENTPDERLSLRISALEAGVAETRKDTRQLKEAYGSFVPTLADTIAKKYIIPGIVYGLSHTIEVPDELVTNGDGDDA